MNERVVAAAHQGAATAGVATLLIGAGLLLAPERAGRALGLDARIGLARPIGLSDLVLAPALIAARPRWRPMAVRAALNLVLAAVYGSELADKPNPRARGGLVAMLVLTVIDGGSAAILRAAADPNSSRSNPAPRDR